MMMPFDRLEPYDGKLSRTVLRGGSGSNASLLPDIYIYCENDILKLVNCIMENTKGEDSKGGEDFWVSATRSHTNTIPQGVKLCGR